MGGQGTGPNERRSLELELADLPLQLAAYQQELADLAPLPEYTGRRAYLDWRIRHTRRRAAYVRWRLASLES
jgi:hypothetical protein